MGAIAEQHKHPKYRRLTIQLRNRSRFYQGVTFLDGRKLQKSLKTDQLSTAFKLGEEWYRRLLRESVSEARRHPIDKLGRTPTVAELFSAYRLTLPPSKRAYADMKWGPIADFWRTLLVTDVNAQTFRQFYTWRRRRKTPQNTTIKNHSLHKDMMVIRQVLKFAIEEEHLTALPIIPKVGQIEPNPRPWLTRQEWDHLASVAADRVLASTGRVHRQRQDLFDFIVFMIESMMRVGELRALTVGQCRVVPRTKADVAHVLIDVRGKRGHYTAIASGEAVPIFEKRREGLKPTDQLWTHSQRDGFRELLVAAGLRTDAFGNRGNLKSLRATSISFRILAQAPMPNLLQIARAAGTSVQMIDQFYGKRLGAELGVAALTDSLA